MNILRDPYGRRAVGWWAAGLVGLALLCSCSSMPVRAEARAAAPVEIKLQATCVPQTIMACWVAENAGYDTRVAISNISPGIDHAQAEAFVDGAWVPLTVLWDVKTGVVVKNWVVHFPNSKTYKYWTVDEFISNQKEHRDHGKELARRRGRRREEEES